MQTTRIANSVEPSSSNNFVQAVTTAAGRFVQHAERLAKRAAKVKLRLGSSSPRSLLANEETVKLRAVQSERIKLKLLIQERKFDEVLKIATNTKQYESAELAVTDLCAAINDVDTKLELLTRLDQSNSRGTMPAIIAVFNAGHLETAQEIFFQRLENGDLGRLAHNGEAKIFTIMEVLGGIDKSQETDISSEHFEQLVQRLRHAPHRQFELMSEILGDPKPGGFKYSFETNNIALPIRLAAINFLQPAPSAVRERALSYAAKDEDDHVAYNAIIHLNQLWRSQNGMIPTGLELFPLLDIDLLVKLCQVSAAFEWPTAANADELLEQFRITVEQLEQAEAAQDLASKARLEETALRIEDQLKRITERRVNCLQPLLNRITSSLGVPNAQLEASDDEAICAAYLVGTGCIKINRAILLEDKPLSEELMSSLLHEIGHLEQDVLVIRMVADDLNLKFGQHSQLLNSLYALYSAGIGYAPSSMFLLAVLRLRDDKPLTPAQHRRALRLFNAAAATSSIQTRISTLSDRITRISESYNRLESGRLNSKLLSCLTNQNSLATLFKKGIVPSVLLSELRRCSQDLEQLLSERAGKRVATKEAIKQAQKLYQTSERALIEPIVQRLKTLLMQVLSEEYRELDKQRSELRRTGYHEAEAYVISDRVEVIVKALRKGW